MTMPPSHTLRGDGERKFDMPEDLIPSHIGPSAWHFPAVYVPKDNGEINICVDYVQLNKVTRKESYPVPSAGGPQQMLANKKIFLKIDLRSAY